MVILLLFNKLEVFILLMLSGLIGYTGFVGKNLDTQNTFDNKYNSSNINSIKNKEFELLVCSGVKAEKWFANQNPEEDLISINYLIDNLKSVKTKKFVLISTVDVYSKSFDVDEDFVIDSNINDTYGKNRFLFERFVINNFESVLIVRLPALFGKGLKKNLIFDLMNRVPRVITKDKFNDISGILDNESKNELTINYELQDNNTYKLNKNIDSTSLKKIEGILNSANFSSLNFTHKDSVFQFYYLDDLWKDIKTAMNNSLKIVNFVTEPISSKELVHSIFNEDFTNITEKPALNYNIKTKYSNLFNSKNGYIYSKTQILDKLNHYISFNK